MEVLRSYVVRVYRQEAEGIAGVVESVETGDGTPFRSASELWATLCHPVPMRRSLPSTTTDHKEEK